MFLEDGLVGSGHSEVTVIGYAGGCITIKKLIEDTLFEYVKCDDSIFVWLMRECIDLVIGDLPVPHARS